MQSIGLQGIKCSGNSNEFAPLTLTNHNLLEYWFVEVKFFLKIARIWRSLNSGIFRESLSSTNHDTEVVISKGHCKLNFKPLLTNSLSSRGLLGSEKHFHYCYHYILPPTNQYFHSTPTYHNLMSQFVGVTRLIPVKIDNLTPTNHNKLTPLLVRGLVIFKNLLRIEQGQLAHFFR